MQYVLIQQDKPDEDLEDKHPDYCGKNQGKGFCDCGEDEAEEYLEERKRGIRYPE